MTTVTMMISNEKPGTCDDPSWTKIHGSSEVRGSSQPTKGLTWHVEGCTTGSPKDAQLHEILALLTDEEVETAALSSYAYSRNPFPETRCFYAKQYAKRFLSSSGCAKKALDRMKATLRFRQNLDVDGLRNAFDGSDNDLIAPLKEHLATGSLYVEGFDKEGRSTYVFVPRKVEHHDGEWTLKSHVYTLERAIACSQADDKTVNAVVDFNGFSLRNAPPTQVGKEFMTTFRKHYAGAINQIFLVDAPTAFLCLWAVFKPFIGVKTRNKIHFVSSRQHRLAKLYKKNQLASWMIPDGAKNRELDVDEYLFQTPFDCAFDDESLPQETFAQ